MVLEGGESNSFIRSSGIFNKGMVNRRDKISNRALEEDIVKLATSWSRIGETFVAKLITPLGIVATLVRIYVNGT